jgi:MSHA pilin protein MshD
MNTPRTRCFNRGVTLVELIAAIVVIGVALAGVLMVFIRNTSSSADPMIAHQAIAIAEAYLEEALTKNFTADGVEASRDLYDDVMDYDNLTDVGARDQNGTPISGLGGYTVQVQAIPEALTVVTASNAIRVQVTVTPPAPSTGTVVISGYRTNY